MNKAVCKFCGSVMLTEVPEGATETECERIGTMECWCEEACKWRKRQEIADKAKVELGVMLSGADKDSGIDAAPDAVTQLLKSAVDLMAEDMIFKINVDGTLFGKVAITRGAGGKISIKRSQTQSQKREVE